MSKQDEDTYLEECAAGRLDELTWQTMNKEERKHLQESWRAFRKEGENLRQLKSFIDDVIWGNFRQKKRDDNGG